MLVTLVVMTYNHCAWVREAVSAALRQTYQPLEVILSDDHSTDGTFSVLQQMAHAYAGPHSVLVRSNEYNCGTSEHLNRIMASARGELVVAAAGDDISLPHRVARIADAYMRSPNHPQSVHSAAMVIDAAGRTHGAQVPPPGGRQPSPEWMIRHQSGVLGSTHAWSAELFSLFGPLPKGIVREDLAIPFRAALTGGVVYIDEPLVLYRLHGTNVHHKDVRSMRLTEVLADLRLGTLDKHNVCTSYIRDLQTASRMFPDRRAEFDALRQLAHRSETELMVEHELLTSTRGRLRLLLCAYRKGTSARRLFRWALVSFVPHLYLAGRRAFSWKRLHPIGRVRRCGGIARSSPERRALLRREPADEGVE